MQFIISKGKNVDNAVDLGLDLMGLPKNKVSIEVIQRGKKGFLTFFSEEAIVKLTKRVEEKNVDIIDDLVNEMLHTDEKENLPSQKIASDEKLTKNDSYGKVWIEGGKIYSKTNKGSYPSITIPEQITVLRNGKEFQGKSLIISDKETYELTSQVVQKETSWEITMNTQRTEAYLTVEPGYKLDYEVLDVAPDQHIELTVVENKKNQNGLKLEAVIEKMSALGITYGINHSEIIKAITASERGRFIIATGKLPSEGRNGWFEQRVETEVQVGLKELENGRVDYKDIKSIPVVEKGRVIGIIHPATKGELGCTVTNLPIQAKETYPLKVRCGKGVINLGDEIIAKDTGRPEIEQRGQLLMVSIVPKLIHVGNVDLSSGNITFKGDVEVFGEVANQMSVEATGDIEIHKTINHSFIRASRGVVLHNNSIGSEITSGTINFELESVPQLEHIQGIIDKILHLLGELASSDNYRKNGYYNSCQRPLIQRLIEKRFPEIPLIIKNFANPLLKTKTKTVNGEWQMIAKSLKKIFFAPSSDPVTLTGIRQLSIDIDKMIKRSEETFSKEAYISVPTTMNSKLYSSGDISITGQGCMNTEIQAEGHVYIKNIVRGGEIYGGMGVTIGQAGSIGSTPTFISVAHHEEIRIDKVLEGVILKVGDVIYKFTESATNVRASINEDNQLIVDYSTLN